MKQYDIEVPADRNILLTSYLIGGDREETRYRFLKKLISSGLFPEYKLLLSEEGVHSAVFLDQVDYPWEHLPDCKATFHDVLTIYRKEADYRKKHLVLKTVKEAYDMIDSASIDDLHEKISQALTPLAPDHVFNPHMDGKKSYMEKKASPLGIKTGVSSIDGIVKGLEYGTVTTLFGFIGHGKSTFALNTAYNAMMSGFNTAFITLEVPKRLLYFSLLSMHSYKRAVELKIDPIPYEQILKGELTEEQEKILFDEVEPDYKKQKGNLYLVEYEELKDVSLLGLRSFFSGLDSFVDVVVLDYVQLLIPYVKKYTHNAGARIVRDFTQFAIGGARDPSRIVILVAQSNREGWKDAVANDGHYTVAAISDLNQLERDSSYVISIFLDDKLRQSGECKMSLLKNRSGPIIGQPVIVPVDHRFCSLGDSIKGYSAPVGESEVDDLLTNFDLEDMV